MGVSTDQSIWVGTQDTIMLAGHDNPSEVFNIDLVDNPGAWRNNFKVIKSSLAPAQELVALVVTLVLHLYVSLEGISPAKHIDLHRVVDYQFRRRKRVDRAGVSPKFANCLPHRC